MTTTIDRPGTVPGLSAPPPASPDRVARAGSRPEAAERDDLPERANEPETPDPPRQYARWEMWLAAFGVLLGTGVAGLGLYSSFGALYDKAHRSVAAGGWGWEHPWLLPVGVDLSILAFGIINLLLIRALRPLWWVKWVPRGGTLLTIYLNWQAASSVPSQIGHAALAALWVVFSEIAAHLYAAHIGEAHGARRMGKIRLSRWLCQPSTTFRIWKLMRQNEITEFETALAQYQEWMVYAQRLASKHGTRRWRRKASPEELAPFQLRTLGCSVEEALAVPLMEEVREVQRQANAAFQRVQAEVQQVEADVQLGAARIQAEVDKIRAQGKLEIAKAEAEREAQAEIQRAEADAQLREAERQNALKAAQDASEAKAAEFADETEKRRTLARIEREKAQASWGKEQKRMAAEATEEERRIQADAAARIERDELARRADIEKEQERLAVAEAAKQKALAEAAEHAANETEQRAREVNAARQERLDQEAIAESEAREARLVEETAERQRRAAEHEAAAVEHAARARLNQVDWDVQRVVAMIQGRGESAVTVRVIADELNISTGSAQDRKTRALELLKGADGHRLTELAA